jgi:hypothetical protein
MNRIAKRWSLLALVSIMGAAAAAACGGSGTDASLFPNPNDGGASGEGGVSPPFDEPTTIDAAPHTLAISPADATLDVTAPGATVAFTALLDGVATPYVSWNLDTGVAGGIDAAGVFTANGSAGGLIHVYAETPEHAKAQATLTVRLHVSENPGGVDTPTQTALKAGGAADGTFAWLYPYDGTVFPRGLLPPLLQFAGTGATAFYVKVTSAAFEYEGFYAGSDPLRLEWSPALWRTITLTAMEKDPVKIEVTKASPADGGVAVTGPVTESWTIAQGSLKGIVYYNTYDSPLAAGDAGLGSDEQGAVMRIRPSASQPEVFLGGAARGSCTVCHTISANGTTMSVSAGHKYDGVWTIDADASAPTGPISQKPDNAYSFGALTPDGKYLLSSGAQALDGGAGTEAGAPPGDGEFGPNNVSMTHDQDTVLYDTASGNVVVSQILGGTVKKALMPAFSPDGKRVAFMDYGATQGTGLSVMDFDETTQAFSNLSLVVSDPSVIFGWPSFLPDGNQFIYQVGDRDDYGTWRGGSGELLIADIATKTPTKLRLLNGTKDGQSYLQDPHEVFLNYQPTVLPVAEGGYYWVVFTSRRMYGNVITEPDETEGVRKKLWIAAIDVNAPSGVDPSHPAFYLPGQELASGNLRAFWALEPCRQTGTTCESGSECCTGFCRQVSGDAGSAAFACVAPPLTCSQEDERCTVASDCCATTNVCINGRCARPTPR